MNTVGRFYEFGPFRIDALKRLLLLDGKPVPLTPKAFDTLLVLVQNSGKVLNKDELMRMIWPDCVVEEGNLAQNIHMLRKILGESPNDHRYIVTVPGQGYCFVARVKELQDSAANATLQDSSGSGVAIRRGETEDLPLTLRSRYSILGSALDLSRWRSRRVLAASTLLMIAALSYFWISSKLKQAATSIPARSIAVLPFKPLSGESGDEYLGVGVADALIAKLVNIRQLIVRPTSSVRKYATPEQDPVAAGRELKVDFVLDGSIQRLDNRIRVRVQLVRVRDGVLLWAESFDDNFTSIFAVQDSISEQVARELMLKLTGKEKRQLTKRYTENTEAYQHYLKGRYYWNKMTVEGLKKGIEHFQQAIENDPNYALAYAGLADSYNLLGAFRYGALPPREAMTKARAAAEKALEIDDTLAEAHTSLAYVKLFYDWDWLGAERGFKRAIELNPNYATAHHWYAHFLTAMGQHDEAIREMKRAQELDPLSLIISSHLGWTFYRARKYDQAIEQYLKTLEMDSNFVRAHSELGEVYVQKGMYDEAIAEFQKALSLSRRNPVVVAALGYAYAVSGSRREAQKVLEELKELSERRYVPPYSMILIYAGLGDKEKAFAWLEKAYEERSHALVYLKVDPMLDGLRADARFQNLLRRMRFPL